MTSMIKWTFVSNLAPKHPVDFKMTPLTVQLPLHMFYISSPLRRKVL